jgi:hypothetical protein
MQHPFRTGQTPFGIGLLTAVTPSPARMDTPVPTVLPRQTAQQTVLEGEPTTTWSTTARRTSRLPALPTHSGEVGR